jgi:hypothetical protein
MAFTAAYLTIRGVFIRRARGQHKTDRGDALDRGLIALVNLGQTGPARSATAPAVDGEIRIELLRAGTTVNPILELG